MLLRQHLAAALLFATAPLALALAQSRAPQFPQSADKPLAFDVVTIKPSNAIGWNLYPTADGYHGMGVTLRSLIQSAYGVYDSYRVTGGPTWIDKDRFDLEAKFDPAAAPNAKNLAYRQRADMLRAVLADRFQFKAHFITKEFPAYDLVIAKGSPKLTETAPEQVSTTLWGPTCLHKAAGRGTELMVGCTMGDLAGALSSLTGRNVVDKTGTAGRYTIELHYTPDNTPADSPLNGGPSVFTAVQEQLGLKLEPSTTVLDVLVIDSAQKPSEN